MFDLIKENIVPLLIIGNGVMIGYFLGRWLARKVRQLIWNTDPRIQFRYDRYVGNVVMYLGLIIAVASVQILYPGDDNFKLRFPVLVLGFIAYVLMFYNKIQSFRLRANTNGWMTKE